MILAGDIGGTKTNLALFSTTNGALVPHHPEAYPSQRHSSFHEILQQYRSEHPVQIDSAAFGIAGPVIDGRCEATNLPWIVDAREVATSLGITRCGLVNDLEATAYGALHLDAGHKHVLNDGTPRPRGTIAIIAAGTGLGEGGLVWDGSRYRTLPSEGGHSDFAPRNELEMEILRFMLTRYERVSYERLLSGPGLYALYEFFKSRATGPEPQWLRDKMEESDPPAVVSSAALEGKDETCRAALETFVSLYGAETGNLALKLLATGGVYVGGGIAPKILPAIRRGSFMKSFAHKGRFSGWLHSLPLSIILNQQTALLGAAHYATIEND